MQAVSYEGWDVHDGLIGELQSHHGNERVWFRVADISQNPMPKVDLIICRDVLFYLENQLACQVLDNVKASGSRYFISTTYPGEAENTAIQPYLPIEGWGFRRINLDKPPFHLDGYLIKKIKEQGNSHKGVDRYVALYKIS